MPTIPDGPPTPDTPIPLATWADLSEGPFADLVQGYTSPTVQADLMIEATRRCEGETQRRLAPFTGLVESHRATGVDPDEWGSGGGLPVSMQATLGMSYANALGSTGDMVRHCWVNEYPARYQDLWVYSDVSVTTTLSIGGTQTLTSTQLQGPEYDGHLWFQLGTLLPVGSLIRATYSGGYQTVPASLARACKLMAASIAARELDPLQMDARKDPEALEAAACTALKPFMRDGGR